MSEQERKPSDLRVGERYRVVDTRNSYGDGPFHGFPVGTIVIVVGVGKRFVDAEAAEGSYTSNFSGTTEKAQQGLLPWHLDPTPVPGPEGVVVTPAEHTAELNGRLATIDPSRRARREAVKLDYIANAAGLGTGAIPTVLAWSGTDLLGDLAALLEQARAVGRAEGRREELDAHARIDAERGD